MNLSGYFDLSLAQQDVYFDQLKKPDVPLYNVGGFINMSGIDEGKVVAAHRAMTLNEDIFGLRITEQQQKASQYFAVPESRESSLLVIDFSCDNTPKQRAEEWLKEAFSKSFTLHDAQLFRSFLVKIGESHYWYVAIAHHLMMDGWGFANWARRLNDFYNDNGHISKFNGKWKSVVEQDLQYLTSSKYEKDQCYWTKLLALSEAPMFTPHYQLQQKKMEKSIRLKQSLDRELITAIHGMAAENKVSVSQCYLSVFVSYLSLAYERDQVTLGLPVHNRKNFEQKQMLGMFAGMTPFTIEVQAEQQFTQLLQSVSRRQKSDLRHQSFPIGHILANLNASRQSLYEVAFSYLKLDSHLEFDGEPAEIEYVAHDHEALPLMLTVWDYGDGQSVEFHLDVNLNFFTQKEGEAVIARLTAMCEQVVGSDPLIQSIALENSHACAAVQSEFEARAHRHARIEDYFWQQVEIHPTAPAIYWQQQSWSYRELADRVTVITKALLALSPTAEQKVAVYLPRTPDLVATLLAVLSAGCAYVPLDMNYPESRNELLLKDSGAEIVIVNEYRAELTGKSSHQLVLPAFANDIEGFKRSEFAGGSQLSHLIYTSGSTGKPKGVEICHNNVTALIEWAEQYFAPEELSQVLASTSINFDLSVFEIFVPLSLGHSIYLVENALTLLQHDIPVSLINTVPSAMSALVNNAAISNSVLTINLAGEALSSDLVNMVFAQTKCKTVNNLYGPSEDTTYSTVQKFEHAIGERPDIGKPISGTQAYVVSKRGRLCPSGIAGELYLSGHGIARGYHNKPDLTEERFITPQFCPEQRMYKTGDLVRLRDDGRLDYLGRIDQQVKISGFRIEPGEIEVALRASVFVKDAVVMAVQGGAGDLLVAYVVAQDSATEIDTSELRRELAATLPAYMLPSHIHVVTQIPLTPNGKVDRLTLAKLQPCDTGNSLLKCVTEYEHTLATLWSEVLGCPKQLIGRDSSFFDLGGRSIQCAHLLNEINREFNVQLPLSAVFGSANLADMADRIQTCTSPRQALVGAPETQRNLVSYAQRAMLLHQKIVKNQAVYNMPVAFEVHGHFSVLVAEQAMGNLINRHHILSRVYQGSGEDFTSQAYIGKALAVNVHDLRELNQDVAGPVSEFCSEAFDLTNELPIRIGWFVSSEQHGILIFLIHHIAADGFSLAILLQQFQQEYNALLQGEASGVPMATFDYADVCYWQNQPAFATQLQQGVAFWRNVLDGAPTSHRLPTNKYLPSAGNFKSKCGRYLSRLDNKLVGLIQAQSRQLQISEFVLLNTAFAFVAARCGDQNDVIIGTPAANRLTPETQNIIGLFVNMLPLRMQFCGDTSWQDQLLKNAVFQHSALAHQAVPFDYLIEQLNPKRVPGKNPYFQLMISFDVDDSSYREFWLDRAEIKPYDTQWALAVYDIELRVHLAREEFVLEWVFDQNLFSPDVIACYNTYLLNVLEQGTLQPELLLAEMQLLPAHQIKHYSALLDNIDEARLANPLSVPQLISDQASKVPDQVAVKCGTDTLTFRQLNTQADQWAGLLHRKGIGKGDRVGILLPRNVGLLAATLGIMKSGAAYVPLDPAYPRARLNLMIEDSKLSAVLVEDNQPSQFFDSTVNLIKKADISLDDVASGVSVPTDGDTAYIIYTSGSTGQPKGVVVSHGALALHICDLAKLLQLNTADNILQLASFSFDTFAEQVFAGLISGATVCLAPETRLDAVTFFSLLECHKITVTDVSVAYLSEWLTDEWRLKWHSSNLRLLVVGGEALPTKTIESWFTVGPSEQCQLLNAYGPTEAVISTCMQLISQLDQQEVRIGQVVGARKLAVLDQYGAWTPPGIEGELYIGGPALASGYWEKDVQTSQMFKPIASDPTTLYYRTGDRVKYNEAGELIFVGRQDNQLSLNGYRIELSEIEAVLLDSPGVEQAIVSAVVMPSGQTALVAYIIPSVNYCQNELAHLVKSKLPLYMQPLHYLALRKWPLTVNGKIDRNNLPLPTKAEDLHIVGDERQLTLQKIWSDLLGLPAANIGIYENFFSLGGNSLLLLRLNSRLKRDFAVDLDIKLLFEDPCIVTLARYLPEELTKEVSHIEDIVPVPAGTAVPASSQQRRLWLQAQLATSHPTAYHMYKGFTLRGPVDVDRIKTAVQTLMIRHPVLSSYYELHDSQLMLLEASTKTLPLYYHEFDQQSGPVEDLLNQLSEQHFALDTGPLVRFHLIYQAPEQHVLFINLHHIVADGWSVSLLLKEFSHLYTQSGSLPHLGIQYKDYANWQYMHASLYESQLTYWQSQLENAPLCHQLPLDFERPQQQAGTGNLVRHSLSAELSTRISNFCAERAVTEFSLLQTAFALLVARHSGQNDVVVGTPVANRNRSQLAPLVGCFMNMVAIRSQFDLSETFEQTLQKNTQTIYSAVANQEVPFELVVERLNPSRTTQFPPIFQLVFVFHEDAGEELDLAGVQVTPLNTQHNSAKFDITLNFTPTKSGFIAEWEYDVGLFEKNSIDKLNKSFSRLLELLMEQPTKPIGVLNLVDASETLDLLELAQGEKHQIPVAKGVWQWMEQQAALRPEKTAVTDSQYSLSYKDLNRRADQFAHMLHGHGVAPGDRVAVCLEKRAELLICLFGIMKAGACYVPIDPGTPAARVDVILKDANVDLLIDSAERPVQWTWQTRAHLRLTSGIECNWPTTPYVVPEITGRSSAYILYTSGSTGVPKGVEISHCALMNFIYAMAIKPGITAADKVLTVTPMSFDISVLELYLPLCFGAEVVIADNVENVDGVALAEVIRTNRISLMQATPILWRMLLNSGWQGNDQLKALCGGEAMPVDLAKSLLPKVCQLWNMYGPTETTVWSSCGEIVATASEYPDIHLGTPILNTQIFILDENLSLVPKGSVGQIYIAGAGLSVGYVNMPTETANAFIEKDALPAYLLALGVSRLYATGDVGYYSKQGQLKHLGRRDHQIKIRGYRIEPSEIEFALNSHPNINDSLVLVDNQRLVAYCQNQGEALSIHQVRAFLSGRLPTYMMPNQVVFLNEFPLTSSGKKDRKRLPKPQDRVLNPLTQPTFVSPIEHKIAGFMQSLVQQPFDADDNFFELGLTSLDLVNLVAHINKDGKQSISAIDAFQYPSLASLARYIELQHSEIAKPNVRPELDKAKQRLMKRIKRNNDHA